MKCWVARRTSRPRGVTPEAAAPATTTSNAIMTKVTMWPRLGPLTRATEKVPRGRVPARLDDTIFLLEGRLERRPLPGSFLCGSSRPPMPGGSLPVPRRSRRYRPALRIRSETGYKASQCGVYPGQLVVCALRPRLADFRGRCIGPVSADNPAGRISRGSDRRNARLIGTVTAGRSFELPGGWGRIAIALAGDNQGRTSGLRQ